MLLEDGRSDRRRQETRPIRIMISIGKNVVEHGELE